MVLKDNKQFDLPELMGGWFSGMDRLEIPYNILILREVLQRDDNGEIELVCQAADGPEEKRGWILFSNENEPRSKKDVLYNWFKKQIGNDIETIYHAEFAFGGDSI